MNWIEKMIAEQCPQGVKRIKLGEVCEISTGTKPNTIETTGSYKYINAGTTESGYCQCFNTLGDTVTTPSRGQGGIGFVGYQRTNFWCGPLCYRIKAKTPTFLNRYLYLYLSCHNELILVFKCVGGTPAINRKDIESIEIPLPPLSIQEKIVDVLDKFTELIEKTDEEIALRQKQYEYYREKLYTPKENTKIVTVSDLGAITRGKRFVRDDVKENGQPCIHYGDMYTYYGAKAYTTKTFLDRDFPKKMRYAKKGDIVIVGAGENDWDIGVGLAWFGDEPAAVHDACYILEHKENPMYISYFLRTGQYHQQLRKYVSDGKICSFSGTDLGKIKIPVPSLSRQQEIVETLDKFETLISKLKEERELRQKQYEYYREKLLTF